MSKRQRLALGLLVGASLLLMVESVQANLLSNGGFEAPAFPDNSGHFVHVTNPQLPGWDVFSTYQGTVLFNTGYDPVTEGSQAVQIEVPGDAISQTFATTVGSVYRLTFDMSAFSGYGGPGLGSAPCPCASILDVSVGPVSASFASSSLGYVTQSLDFVADSTLTTLRLMNPSVPAAIGNYPHLDNVSVVLTTPVPEPETYALMLAGLAALAHAARRRQRR